MPKVRECHDGLLESALTERIIAAFYAVYDTLGYGYLESVYSRAMSVELDKRHLHAARQVPIEVCYQGVIVGAFRADILVESRVVVELKSGKSLVAVNETQLLNYLKATGIQVGLLLHFGPKPSFRRMVWTAVASHRTDPPRSAGSAGSAFPRPREVRTQPQGVGITAAPRPAPGPHPALRPAAYRIP